MFYEFYKKPVKKDNTGKIVLIILGIIAFAVAVFFACKYFFKKYHLSCCDLCDCDCDCFDEDDDSDDIECDCCDCCCEEDNCDCGCDECEEDNEQ